MRNCRFPRTYPTPFVVPAVMVTVEEAMGYARDILAGVDNMLIELADELIDELPMGLTPTQRRRLEHAIRARVDAARIAVNEHEARGQ